MALKIDKKNLTENWRFVVSKITKICWILIRALKSLKNLHFDWFFLAIFNLKTYRGVIFHDTRDWFKIWRKTNLWFRKHEEFGKFSPEHLKVSKLSFKGLALTKLNNVWPKKKGELCLMTLNVDAKFKGKLTFAFKNDVRNLESFHKSTWNS